MDLNSSVCENSVHSFCNLTIFPEGLSEMMSACKARALDEGGMMKTSYGQSWYFHDFLHVLVTSYLEFSPGLKIQCQSDPEPPPGRKSRQGIEIRSETLPKSSKIEKMRNSRKTAENFRIHQFCTFKYAFSLC